MRKRILCSFLLLFLAPVLANSQKGTSVPMTPNMYQLTGGKLHITYSTTSINGQPHFTYQDGTQNLSFVGDQIRQTKTEIGTLVSVTIHMTVDSGSTAFSLLVPTVNLPSPSSPAQIHTYGITTGHRFSVVPAANRGQTETYTITELSGTASVVVF
jgi:hypothetical protein